MRVESSFVDEARCVVCGGGDMAFLPCRLGRGSASFRRCNACGHVTRCLVNPGAVGALVEEAEERGGHVSGEWVVRQLPLEWKMRRGTCLDVGCWDGRTLLELPRHWDCVGVEPNPHAVQAAEAAGLDVRQGVIESADVEEKRWDLVTMLDVAEHLVDPDAAFRRVAELLAPGGLLLVLTGDASSWGARLFGEDWYYLHYP